MKREEENGEEGGREGKSPGRDGRERMKIEGGQIERTLCGCVRGGSQRERVRKALEGEEEKWKERVKGGNGRGREGEMSTRRGRWNEVKNEDEK